MMIVIISDDNDGNDDSDDDDVDLRSNMEMMGKRLPYLARYKAGVDAGGKIRAVAAKIYCDAGFSYNESTADSAAFFAKNCYVSRSWRLVPLSVLTATASNTYVRAPGSTQGHAVAENIVEHVAEELGEDPLEFRLKNMVGQGEEGHPLRQIIAGVRESAEYDRRKEDIRQFNEVGIFF